MGRVERLAEELSSLGAAIAPSEHGAEVGESARPFQPGVTTLEVVHRLAEKRFTALAAGDDSGGTLRHARGARAPNARASSTSSSTSREAACRSPSASWASA